MVLYKSVDRTLEGRAHLHAETFGSLSHFGIKGIGDRAYEVYGQPRTAILLDIAYEEVYEAFNQQGVYLGHIAMLREEGGEAGQETVGQGLSVDFF